MRTVAIITARWNSTRLPGKMLADINGKPLLQWVVDRTRMSKVDDVVVATTESSQLIIKYCKAHDIHWSSIWDEDDIVSRLWIAAADFDADMIVRVWGDCPLVSPEVINNLLETPSHNYNIDCYYFSGNDPKGMGAGLLSFELLKTGYENLTGEDRHWYHRCLTERGLTRYSKPTFGTNLSHIDLSVDDEDSLRFVRSLCMK